jgi:hypothetical protein
VAAKEVAETKPSRNQSLQQAAPVQQQPAWRRLLKAAAEPKPATQPEKEEEKETAVSAAAMKELKPTIAGMNPKLDFGITIMSDGEKKERIAELAEIFQSDKTEEPSLQHKESRGGGRVGSPTDGRPPCRYALP